jgi:enoyl-CoA hydratase/carnithine racemase
MEMLLTNRWISASEAHQIGLVNRVLPRDQLLPVAKEIANQIAAHDPLVMRSTKQAILRGLDLPISEGLELEKRLALRLEPKKNI